MKNEYYKDYLGDEIELTDERWSHIIKEHPEVELHKRSIGEVLNDPEYVKRSIRDREVLPYYRYYPNILVGKYLLIVVRKGIKRSFILTCYIADEVRKGETLWERR